MIDYKKELNKEQYEAVMHDKGPALLSCNSRKPQSTLVACG